ncbi:MAG: response regulator, partial [Lachnospiraceae bacterium]|nr:response regulator [Lachnospiraceae bacterium]
MNIAICDDEELIREQMKELIQSQHIKCQIDDFDSGAELLAAGQFDIIFLDIHMDGMNGMETAKALKAREDPAVLVF